MDRGYLYAILRGALDFYNTNGVRQPLPHSRRNHIDFLRQPSSLVDRLLSAGIHEHVDGCANVATALFSPHTPKADGLLLMRPPPLRTRRKYIPVGMELEVVNMPIVAAEVFCSVSMTAS